jgi:hypothetical protein
MVEIAKLRRIPVLLLAAAITAAAAPPSKLNGMITDSEGAAIDRAQIMVRWDSSGSSVGLKTNVGTSKDVRLETDAMGRFTSELPPGFYDIFVSADGFSPQCHKIRLNAGQTTNYNARLNVDPLITSELGDRMRR